MGLQVLHLHADGKGPETAEGAQHANMVFQMHQAEQRKGKARIGEQLHLQGKRQNMRVGCGQPMLIAKAADLPIARQVLGVYRDLAAHAQLGQAAASHTAAQGGAQKKTG